MLLKDTCGICRRRPEELNGEIVRFLVGKDILLCADCGCAVLEWAWEHMPIEQMIMIQSIVLKKHTSEKGI